jgi:lambda repressor-like predicted transcriptional regulator
MHPAEIQAALKIRGYSQASVARDCGVEPTTVGAVVNGRSRSQRVEARIAELTGLPLERLWPLWHGDPALREARSGLVLSTDEIELVLNYRSLAGPQREQARAMMSVLKLGPAPGNSTVITGGSRVAGRDYHETKGKKSRS